jgi:hypothetical protein
VALSVSPNEILQLEMAMFDAVVNALEEKYKE